MPGKIYPYYQNEWKKVGFHPNDLTSLEVFQLLPFIDKEVVKEHFDLFKNPSLKQGKQFFVTTGGSSGWQMKFFQSKNIWWKELAFVMASFSNYGYKPGARKASFRGGNFDGLNSDTFWKENPIYNELHFSPFHISVKTIKKYVQRLNSERILFFHSYPSAISALISNMKSCNLSLSYSPEAIFLISENYTESQIQEIREFFNCKVMSFYGHSERLIFAPTVDDSLNLYQPDSRYGYCELVGAKGNVLNSKSEKGELVGTSFDNWAMPLIRYRTNDFTSYDDAEKKIFNKIEGRWLQEYLDGKNGEQITLTALNMHSDVLRNVSQYQFCQSKPGSVKMIVIAKSDYSDDDSKAILEAMNSKAGHAIDFSIELAETMKLSARGKFRKIIKE